MAQTYLTGWNFNNNQHRKLHEEHAQSFCSFSRDFIVIIVILISTREVFLSLWRHFLSFATKAWNKVD